MNYRLLLPILLTFSTGLIGCDNDVTQPNTGLQPAEPTASALPDATSRITVTRLSTLRGAADAISESGLIVGTLTGTNGWNHATVWRKGVPTDLTPTLEGESHAIGVNNKGQIVGFLGWTPCCEAVMWQNGTMSYLDPSHVGSRAYGINSAGAIIWNSNLGAWLTVRGRTSALPAGEPRGINAAGDVVGIDMFLGNWLLKNGALTDLGQLSPGAINGRGVVAGVINRSPWGEPGYARAGIWRRGTLTDLGTLPGSDHSEAYGINAAGDVVGYGETASGLDHAILWRRGQIIDLGAVNPSKWSYATGINSAGQIVGSIDDSPVMWTVK
jgi:probable HAF family extracellular repeat protein